MTVKELLEHLQKAEPSWDVYLNPYGENLDIEEVQSDPDMEAIVLVPE